MTAIDGPPFDGGDFGEWAEEIVDELDSDAPTSTGSDPYYSSSEEWVQDFFLEMFRRPEGGQFKWCAQWYLHAEAISRFNALWMSWEQARVDDDGAALSAWYHNHLDHHLPILLGESGPFRLCNARQGTHEEVRKLNAEWAPLGYWD